MMLGIVPGQPDAQPDTPSTVSYEALSILKQPKRLSKSSSRGKGS